MNQHQVRQQQNAENRLRFIRALSAGQVHVLDRFGTKIEAGAKILFHAPVDMVYEVQSVQPDLSANAQPGQMTVTIGVVMPIPVGCNTPWPNAIVLQFERAKPATVPIVSEEPEPVVADVKASGPTGLVGPQGQPLVVE